MPFTDLPVEVLSLLVDEFLGDKAGLKTLSLLSQPLYFLCRSHLFFTLRLNTLNPSFDHKCRALTDIICGDKTLLLNIRVLEVGPPVFRLMDRERGLLSQHWKHVVESGLPSIHDKRIQRILEGSINITSLTLRFEHQSWLKLSSDFQNIVLESIRRPTLATLSLEDVSDFPLHILQSCRALDELSLICVNSVLTDSIKVEGTRDPKPHPLHGLTLYLSEECVRPLVNLLSTPSSALSSVHLQRLSVDAVCDSVWSILHERPTIAESITALELRIGQHDRNYSGYGKCNIANFPSLRSLLISTSYGRRRRPIIHMRDFFTRTSKTMTKAMRLEQLSVALRLDMTGADAEESLVTFASEQVVEICNNSDWLRLEKHLACDQFPALCKMAVIFKPGDVAPFMNDELRSVLHQHLARNLPVLYPLTNPTIDVHNDRFEEFAAQIQGTY